MTSAFDPYVLGGIKLANRIVMAPMTRSRAYGPGLSPTDLMAEYYSQRAGAGLIITEAIQPSVVAQGYINTPGLHSAEQVEGWRKVTDAVHTNGGRIYAQLLHCGRIGLPSLRLENVPSLGVSAVKPDVQMYTLEGMQDIPAPVEMTGEDIRQTIRDFALAAGNAVEAGFDGIELHGANGYLIQQFLATNTNLRTDEWGGSVENRIRFAVELTKAVAAEIGPERVALRVSPGVGVNDITETDTEELYLALTREISKLGIAYLHVIESPDGRPLAVRMREAFTGPFMLNPGTENPTGLQSLSLVEEGVADLVSYGALYTSNPDLAERLRRGGPFIVPDQTTFYGGDAKGYTDFPTLD
ncbi:alkene reductase [Streptomyces sp. NPDC016675]|uniref:alkene reductase n=1 Tax=Streptomyces sp. NPDC016675 TaxID=3364970 RepID=UPI0036F6C4C3